MLLPSALAATAQTSAANQAIVLSLAGGNMTVGTGGSAVVKVAYRVHSGL
jgi:hypothetical protein